MGFFIDRDCDIDLIKVMINVRNKNTESFNPINTIVAWHILNKNHLAASQHVIQNVTSISKMDLHFLKTE